MLSFTSSATSSRGSLQLTKHSTIQKKGVKRNQYCTGICEAAKVGSTITGQNEWNGEWNGEVIMIRNKYLITSQIEWENQIANSHSKISRMGRRLQHHMLQQLRLSTNIMWMG